MKKDVTELKRMFLEVLQNPNLVAQNPNLMNQLQELKTQELIQPLNQPVLQPVQPVLMHNDRIHEH